MAGNNGTASLHRPSIDPYAGQLTLPGSQQFAPSPPQQYGHPTPIPNNQQGITALRGFTKINRTLAPGPIAKIVVKIQQARF